MHAIFWLYCYYRILLFSNCYVSEHLAPEVWFQPQLELKPWFFAGVLQISLLDSQPFAYEIFRRTKFYSKHVRSNCFGLSMQLSCRHASALRWLLILSGNVELNPGPTLNFEDMTVSGLTKILSILYEGDDTFVMPKKRDEMVAILQSQNQNFVNLAFQKAFGISVQPPPPPATNATVTSPGGTRARLPEFYEADARSWFR